MRRVAAGGQGPLSWLRSWWRGVPRLRKVGAFLGLAGGIAGVILALLHVGEWPADKQDVYKGYNDALVADNLSLAWSFGCPGDRSETSLSDFSALYQSAIAPLGELTSWRRLRGGPEWIGTKHSTRAMPEIDKVGGHYCVRLGGSPLGTPF